MSVENYQREMILAKEANKSLEGLTSTSKTSIWRMMLYIMAYSVEQIAQLFALHRSETDVKISTQKTHRLPWIQSLYLNFQYGFGGFQNISVGQHCFPPYSREKLSTAALTQSEPNSCILPLLQSRR